MPVTDRLREHPEDRFDAPALRFDLGALATELRREPHQPVDGHRQLALYKRSHATLVLYVFDRGGEIPPHVADGVETIQVLQGRVTVTVDEAVYEIGQGQLLTVAPNVRHGIRAMEPAEMLLTVHFIAT